MLIIEPHCCPTEDASHGQLLPTEASWFVASYTSEGCGYCRSGVCIQRVVVSPTGAEGMIIHGTAGVA